MPPFQPQHCDCSLRDGVAHVVRNRSDWNRHVHQKRNDIQDQEETAQRQRQLPPPVEPLPSSPVLSSHRNVRRAARIAIAHHSFHSGSSSPLPMASPVARAATPEVEEPANYPANLGSSAPASLLLYDPASPRVASPTPLRLQYSDPSQALASGVTSPANEISSSADADPGHDSDEPLAYESDDSGCVGNMYRGIVVSDIDTDEEAFFLEDPHLEPPYEEPEVEIEDIGIDAVTPPPVALGDTPNTIDDPFVRP